MAEDRQPFRQDSLDVPPPGVDKPRRSSREERRPAPEQDARRRRAQQQRRRNSVFQYIAILFMAAFVLLLYTFMMERRQNQQQIDELMKSASTVQTLQGLMDENAKLKEQVDDLEVSQEGLEKKLRETVDESQAKDIQLAAEEKKAEALVWFWQINDAYVRGRFNQCRELITAMYEAELTGLLPTENIASEDFLSPADRYQEIYDRVMN